MTCHQECCSGCPSFTARPLGSTARALSNQRPNRLVKLFGGSVGSVTATPEWWSLSCQCSLVGLLTLCFVAHTALAHRHIPQSGVCCDRYLKKGDPGKGEHHGPTSWARGRSPRLPHRRSGSGTRRPPSTHRGHAVARKGDRRR